jgi:hypothetical protein
MKILTHVFSVGISLVISIPAFAAQSSVAEECKVYDITQGDLRLRRSDGKKITEITKISGNVSDIDGIYGPEGIDLSKETEEYKYHVSQIGRAKVPFNPLAILFQPSGEILQLLTPRKLPQPMETVVVWSNINHVLAADHRNKKYNKLGTLDRKDPKLQFKYAIIKSTDFKSEPLPHLQNGEDLTICYK